MGDLFNLKNKKFTWKSVVFLLAIMIVFMILQRRMSKSGFDNQLVRSADEINKSCPRIIDSSTRLDNAVALTNKKFQFNYTFLTVNKSTFDTVSFVPGAKSRILATIRTDPNLKVFREKEISISFVYHDTLGAFLCRILVNPEEYN